MKVLYFHQHFSTPQGGTGTRSFEFSKALLNKGHEVTVVCGSFDVGNTGLNLPFNNGRREGLVEGIKVIEYHLPYSNKQSFFVRAKQFARFALKCCAEVNREEPDLVFCTSTPLTISIPGIYAKLFRRLPFVFEVRDLWPELPVAMGVIKNRVMISLLKGLEIISYKMANHVIALSEGMSAGVQKHIETGRVTTISNGCDLYLAPTQGEDVINLPKEISEEDLVAIYAGTHGIANGLDVLVETAKFLQESGHTEVKIILVGEGMLKSQLEARAVSLKLKNIFFLDGMPKKRLFSLYKRCHVGLMILKNVPAFYDGTSPNKFFDYLTSGLAVVCNYSGWINRLIVDHHIGLSVPAESPKELAKVLNKLNAERETLPQMSENAQKLAVEQFDRSMLANQFVNILEEVVADGKK